LRVLNDDQVAPAKGFGTHPHRNMEIISIPLSGSLEHTDNMGNQAIIHTNDVQIMSAGTGVTHAEYNHSDLEWVNFLQLWILPKAYDITPRYHQRTFPESGRHNRWQTVVSPEHEGEGITINQNAFIQRATMDAGTDLEYSLSGSDQGVYLLVLDGSVKVDGQELSQRDALGLWGSERLTASAHESSELILIEVPMT